MYVTWIILLLGGCATDFSESPPEDTSKALMEPSVQSIIAIKPIPNDEIVKIGKAKAEQLGLNPIYAHLNNNNNLMSNKAFPKKGDMLINVGRIPFTYNDIQLSPGEYLVINGNDPHAKDVSALTIPKENVYNPDKIITIRGKILNFNQMNKEASRSNPYLSIVKVYKKGNKDAPMTNLHTTDKQGNKTSLVSLSPNNDDCALLNITVNGNVRYYSDLPPIQIPSNPNFIIKIIDLKPDRYFIAAYGIKNLAFFSPTNAAEPVIINLPDGYENMKFDIGDVLIREMTSKKQ